MRFPFLYMLAAIPVVAIAQGPSGTFKQSNGLGVPWRISENHTLIWDSKPYIPFGLRIKGSAESIANAKARGVRDVLVELPANGMGWSECVAALEQNGMRYMIAIDSLAPGATGFGVEPQSYRVSGITGRTPVDLAMPGVDSALAVLALRRDSSISSFKRVKVEGERFRMDAQSPNQLEHILLIYPETSSISVLDAWDGLDEHRDSLLRSIRNCKFGAGMRGFVNPLGAMIPQASERLFVPNSSRFQSEFAGFLEQRYRNVQSVQRAWSMSANELETFADLARLVPLWAGSRGVSMVWDPKTDTLIQVEAKRSLIWNDVRTVIATAEAKRFTRLISALRKACDVPVVQEWVGWSSYYEQPNPALDGIACQTSGTTFSTLAESFGRAASTVFRWNRNGLFYATSVDLRNEPASTQIAAVSDDLFSAGVRGAFFRTDDPNFVATIVQEAGKRADDPALADWSPRAVYFPESALNPANIQRLPGGKWWLPSPESGNRIELGSQFTSYRVSSPSGTTIALWSNAGVKRIRLLLADPQKARFTPVDGFDPDVKISKNKLELNIGSSPILIQGVDEIPIPQPALDEALVRFAAMLKEADKYKMDVSEEAFSFRDAYSGFDRNPGGSFSQMTAALQKLNARLARFMWIEAEAFRESTFSEVLTITGTSGNAVLNLRSPFEAAANDYFAEYAFTPRSGEDLEVWIAARIPKESRNDVNVLIGSQLLKITTEPVSHYGSGFGWYKLGMTRLGGVQSAVQIRVFPQVGAELAIDALLFYPGQFSPKGARQPDAVVFDLNAKPEKPGGEYP